MRADLIAESLETAAARCADLTPRVYERLFAERPDLRALFRDGAGLVQGEMLARTLDAILDFIGDDAYARNLVAGEAATHAAYGVPRETFILFFRVVADAIRELLGDDWRAETESAWRELAASLSACAQPEDLPA